MTAIELREVLKSVPDDAQVLVQNLDDAGKQLLTYAAPKGVVLTGGPSNEYWEAWREPKLGESHTLALVLGAYPRY